MEEPSNESKSVKKQPKFPFPKNLTPAQRRWLLLGLSFLLGASCGFVPEEWQRVCKISVKFLMFFISPS